MTPPDDRTFDHIPEPSGTVRLPEGMTPTVILGTIPHTSPAASEWAPPGFAIEKELGRGGMGIVYLAHQAGLNRPVALKLIKADEADSVSVLRFLAEAEAMAAVRHPNVAQVYQYGQHDGRPFLALEYCGGGSLYDRIRATGKLDPTSAAKLIAAVADGVQAAHAAGIVHRDLKPANVLFDAAGVPKVTDFGLAKRGTSELTRTQAVMGTPAFMSPEQAKGDTKFVGPPADVWALGVILYECLTGRRPFDATDTWQLLQQVIGSEPATVRSISADVPRDLGLIVHKCLEKDTADRYATAAELAADLSRFLAGEPVSVRVPGTVERMAKWARRKPTLATAYTVTAVAMLLAGLTTGAVWLWQRAEHDRHDAVEARDELGEQKKAVESARDELAKEREKLARVEYARTIQVAHQSWRDNSVGTARALLAGTRSDLRGWEYDYVHRLCHADLVTFKGHTSYVHQAAFSPDGRRVVTGSEDNTARVWDTETGRELLILRHNAAVRAAAFSPDGRRVATGGMDDTLRVWDAQSGREILVVNDKVGYVDKVEFSPDGLQMLTSGDTEGARVRDAVTGKVLHTFPHSHFPFQRSYSADSRRVVTADSTNWEQPQEAAKLDRNVRVRDAVSGKELLVLRGHVGWTDSGAFSSDGRYLVTAGGDKSARVWDATTGKELRVLKGIEASVRTADISPDGRRVVTTHRDSIARVWDVESGREVEVLKGHAGQVESGTFSPNGGRVLTTGSDGTVRVWNAENGRELVAFKGHTGLSGFSGGRDLLRSPQTEGEF